MSMDNRDDLSTRLIEARLIALGLDLALGNLLLADRSRLINLVVTDAGSRSPLDLADWVDAGFIVKR
jgi:hypothetical protein